jgi:hypothetical protein
MSWWTTKGEYATKLRKQEEEMLRRCVKKWGNILLHVFDRGYASGSWIQLLQSLRVRFVIRWIKKHHFFGANGKEKKLWQIELSFRYGKCELAMESPRLWSFENRIKLLGVVTLVYAFLLHLLLSEHKNLIKIILHLKCHRTGKRCQDVLAPLYRLRWAISRLWDDYHPILGSLFPPNLETLQVLASS